MDLDLEPTKLPPKLVSSFPVPTSHIRQCRLQKLLTPRTIFFGPKARWPGQSRSFTLRKVWAIMRHLIQCAGKLARTLSDVGLLSPPDYSTAGKKRRSDPDLDIRPCANRMIRLYSIRSRRHRDRT